MHPSILWLNGDAGSDLATAAAGLVSADSRWRAADPEPLGSFLRDAERSWGEDVQAHPRWPALVVAGLHALDPSPERPVVVPMAVHHPDRWRALKDALRLRVQHVVLQAGPTDVLSWQELGGTMLHTDVLSPEEVVLALRAGWDRLCGRTA